MSLLGVLLCVQAYWFVDFYTLNWGREKIEEFMDTCQVRLSPGWWRTGPTRLLGQHTMQWLPGLSGAEPSGTMSGLCLGGAMLGLVKATAPTHTSAEDPCAAACSLLAA